MTASSRAVVTTRADRLVVGAVGAITLLLGAIRVGDQAFWYDEVFTSIAVDQPFGALLRQLRTEAGMYGFYLGLWAWRRLGDAEWWLRMFSVVGAAVAVAGVWLLAVRIGGRRVAALSVIALWCNPFFLRNLTELRAYSWTMCLAVLVTLAVLRFRDAPSSARAVVWGAGVGVMLGLLAFTVSVVIAQVVVSWRWLFARVNRGRLLAATAVGTICFLPALPALLASNQLDWIKPASAALVVRRTMEALGGGSWAVAVTGGFALLVVPRVRRSAAARDGWALLVCVVQTAAVPLVLLVLCLLQPLFLTRYLTPMLPFALITAVTGYVAVAEAYQRHLIPVVAAALVGLSFIGFPGSVTVDDRRIEDMRSVAERVGENFQQSDIVVFDPPRLSYSFEYYWNRTGRPSVVVDPLSLGAQCRVWLVHNTRGEGDTWDRSQAIFASEPVETTQHLGFALTLYDIC
ncbi:MAG: hypothetical protein WCP59_01915 [Actinomycetota bacterium]